MGLQYNRYRTVELDTKCLTLPWQGRNYASGPTTWVARRTGMRIPMSSITRRVFIAGLMSVVGADLLMVLLMRNVNAQSNTATMTATSSSIDGSTPTGLAPGGPAGSYALSGFDNINMYNGNLDFRLPLLHIGGRGSAGYTMVLPIKQQKWRVEFTHQQHVTVLDLHTIDVTYDHESWSAVKAWWTGLDAGYGPGVLQGRRTGWSLQDCVVLSNGVPNPIVVYQNTTYQHTLTRLTFTAADGTEYDLRDQSTHGQPGAVTDPCNTTGTNRGTIFTTADGTSATFIQDPPSTSNPAIQDSNILLPE